VKHYQLPHIHVYKVSGPGENLFAEALLQLITVVQTQEILQPTVPLEPDVGLLVYLGIRPIYPYMIIDTTQDSL
jgi:hypothetical protein